MFERFFRSSRKPAPKEYHIKELVGVLDGDTFYCTLEEVDPVLEKHFVIRVYGVECPEFRIMSDVAIRARYFTQTFLCNPNEVKLIYMGADRYGRNLFKVITFDDKHDLAQLLIENNLGKEYYGVKK